MNVASRTSSTPLPTPGMAAPAESAASAIKPTVEGTINVLDKVRDAAQRGSNAAAEGYSRKNPDLWWRAQAAISGATQNLAHAYAAVDALLPTTEANVKVLTNLLEGVADLAVANVDVGIGWAQGKRTQEPMSVSYTMAWRVESKIAGVIDAVDAAKVALRNLEPTT